MPSRDGRISESELQDAIVQAADFYGWNVHHSRPGRTLSGWRTPITGRPGFPDLVLALDGIVHVWELKAAAGRLTRDQMSWAAALGNGDRVALDYRIVRPSTFDDALAILERDAAGRRR